MRPRCFPGVRRRRAGGRSAVSRNNTRIQRWSVGREAQGLRGFELAGEDGEPRREDVLSERF